ncbi:5'-methylthioadenosine/S-adenosylhomocysteine nucleosidase family protein [Aspergillus foveolatus]|uniref:5'-methylthioadenosine/S-adenosylhomocysteine nucleosidase family protein n=1 Tax=Aspergillus foveolatus TaxID=210207 RepID=UPI003CCE1CD2
MTIPAQRPSRRADFEIAIICALPLEYDAVSLVFDEFWDEDGDSYGRSSGDTNTYTTGRIGRHNVVLVLLSCMGKISAASAASSLRSSYSNVRLALLTGTCAGVPQADGNGSEILLGDVVISKTIVQCDFGRQYHNTFVRKNTVEDNLGRPRKEIWNLLRTFETESGLRRLEQRAALILKKLQADAIIRQCRTRYQYPGTAEDRLFNASYHHKHRDMALCVSGGCQRDNDPACEAALRSSCDELHCDGKYTIPRERLKARERLEQGGILAQDPKIYVGAVASSDMVIKSGEHRDRIAQQESVIAFEMEGAAVWEALPSIVVKGVSDYADSHKSKKWQSFAAAAAACTSKAILERYIKEDIPSEHASWDGKLFSWGCMSGPGFEQSRLSILSNVVADDAEQINEISPGKGIAASIVANYAGSGGKQLNLIRN